MSFQADWCIGQLGNLSKVGVNITKRLKWLEKYTFTAVVVKILTQTWRSIIEQSAKCLWVLLLTQKYSPFRVKKISPFGAVLTCFRRKISKRSVFWTALRSKEGTKPNKKNELKLCTYRRLNWVKAVCASFWSRYSQEFLLIFNIFNIPILLAAALSVAVWFIIRVATYYANKNFATICQKKQLRRQTEKSSPNQDHYMWITMLQLHD